MLFGSPANPMDDGMVDGFRQVVAQVPGIEEAYLPQCYIEGDETAQQVLIVGVSKQGDIQNVMPILMEKLRLLLGEGNFIDVMPFPTRRIPSEAKVIPLTSGTLISGNRPWWKLW